MRANSLPGQPGDSIDREGVDIHSGSTMIRFDVEEELDEEDDEDEGAYTHM